MRHPFAHRAPSEMAVKPEIAASNTASTDTGASNTLSMAAEDDLALTPQDKGKPAPAHILSGPVGMGVLKVALPSVATMVLTTLNSFLDRWFVGHLGADVLAAVTSSNTLMFLLMAAAMGVSVGTSALVSRFVGQGNLREAERAAQQSLLLGVVLAVLIGIPMWLLRHAILTGLGVRGIALHEAEAYLLVTVAGLPSLFLMVILSGIFRGLGDTVRPLWITSIAILVHGSFNYLLIFGNHGFPKMGLMGGALALVLSQLASTLLFVVFLRQSSVRNLPLSLALKWDWATRILKIGIPAAGQQVIRVGSMLVFQAMLTRTGFGTAALAALGVGLLSESIAFMPGFGYSIAASAFVGQNLGAKQIARAEAGAYAATLQAVVVMTVMGIVFWVFAEPFARFFIQHGSHESLVDTQKTEDAIHLTIWYLRAAAWSEPFLGIVMVLNGALQGAGDTVLPTLFTFIAMVLIRLPLTYLFAFTFNGGVHGAWWAMSLSTIINSAFTYVIFRRGRWRSIRV